MLKKNVIYKKIGVQIEEDNVRAIEEGDECQAVII